MKRSIIGNQAVAYGALAAGIDVAAGYPGTPSSEALNELLHFSRSAARGNDPSPYVEWSVNEKVAFELATGAAWAGKRALATMKMSGANVAADSILSVAYSGTKGGLVLYIADDPGAEAGMPEQDTRLFAQWAGLPVLEPADPARAYQLTRYAFELSERCELPVILRSVTSVAHAKQEVEGEYAYKPLKRKAAFQKNILRYTKAGAVICMDQHRDLLERLKVAESSAAEAGINRLHEADDGAGLFVVAAGATSGRRCRPEIIGGCPPCSWNRSIPWTRSWPEECSALQIGSWFSRSWNPSWRCSCAVKPPAWAGTAPSWGSWTGCFPGSASTARKSSAGA